MRLNEFLLAEANRIKNARGSEMALLVTPDLKIKAIGEHKGNADDTYQTAIVNALSNCASEDIDGKCLLVSTYAPTNMCRGMGKLLLKSGIVYSGMKEVPTQGNWASDAQDDKKATIQTNLNSAPVFATRYLNQDLKKAFTDTPIGPAPAHRMCESIDSIYMHLTMAMLGTTWNPNKGHSKEEESGDKFGGNNVAAVLVKEDKVVAWGLNVMAQNKTLHAETAMISAYLAANNLSKLPTNTRIISSLQPCDMCAGFIDHVKDSTTEVVYGMKDGELTTVLTSANKEKQLRQDQLMVPIVVPDRITPGSIKQGSIQELRPPIKGPSTAVLVDKDGVNVGDDFRQFAKALLDAKKDLRDATDQREIAKKNAVDNSIELLRKVAIQGMMTSYGIDVINGFFAEMPLDPKPTEDKTRSCCTTM